MKLNEDKCHLLVNNHEEDANIGSEPVKSNASVKLLSVIIDNKLDFEEHVSNICNKVGSKLHTLARMATT